MGCKKLVYLLVLFFLFLNLSSSRAGDFNSRKKGVHSGNRVRTTFFNYGLIGRMSDTEYGGEWPIGSGHLYVGDIDLLIGAEIVTADGDTIHSVEVNDSPRGNNEVNPSNPNEFWGWEPLPGYANPDTDQVAMSHLPQTWPPYWPDRMDDPEDPGWPGSWNGYFGKNVFRANQESYFVIDDDADEEFNFYPDSTNPTRRGLGLEVKARGLQWDFPPELRDVVFWIYDITNVGTTDYAQVVFGVIFGNMMGAPGDYTDDCADFNQELNLAYAYDFDGIGGTGWGPVGYTGYVFLETPDDSGLTSFYYFHPFNKVKLRDDEQLWDCLKPGYYSIPAQDVDGDFITGSGYFSLGAGETKRVVTAMAYGQDLDDLLMNVRNARSFQSGDFQFNACPINLTFPVGGEILNGNQTISWENEGAASVDIYYSPDRGQNWNLLASGEANDGEYIWETDGVPDGINYLLYIVAKDTLDVIVGLDFSDSLFTINNPGNAIPEVDLLAPEGGEEISGDFDVRWVAGDADGNELTMDILLSNDDGLSWETIAENEPNDSLYDWNTIYSPNGSSTILKVVAKDEMASGEAQSQPFILENFHPALPDTHILHYQGSGTGGFSVHIVDSTDTTDHLYRLTFDDTTSPQKTYSVYDLTTNQFVIQGDPHLSGRGEGPLFDGLRLLLDDDGLTYDDSGSGWISGNSNFEMEIKLQIVPNLNGVPLPKDFEIRFSNSVVETSTAFTYPPFLDLPSKPTTFEVWNLTDGIKQKFAYGDFGQGGSLDDELIIILFERNDSLLASWGIHLEEPSGIPPVVPGEGDTLFIHINKPFTSQDVFLFSSAEIPGVEEPSYGSNLPSTFCLFQNYPNPFNSSTTISYNIPQVIGGRFKVKGDPNTSHLIPITLKVYNPLGEKVRTLVEGRQKAGFHRVYWNGKNDDDQDVSSGIYFYMIKAGDYRKAKKMILLR